MMTRLPTPRVMFTIGSAQKGGAEGQLVRIAAGLAERGHAVAVLFLVGGGELTSVLDAAGVPWKVARPPVRRITGPGRDVLMVLRMGFYLRRWRPTVVMAWLPGAIWPTLLMARVLTSARRIAALRGGTFAPRWEEWLLRRALACATSVTINAPALIGEAERLGVASEQIHCIPNGVEIPVVLAKSVRQQPPTAVVVANYRWYKGHDVLMRALAMVESPVRVRLLGEGSGLAETQRLAKELGVSERVDFVPYPPDVPRELHSAQFAIHPSLTEGLSNAILEELSTGLPVAATNVGGTPILIEDGAEGFLVPARDPQALAAAIDKLASDPDLRAQMGSAARARARDFSWTRCIDVHEQLLLPAPRVSTRGGSAS